MLNIKNEGIILEKTGLPFENKAVLNPACIKVGNITHMFYRAINEDSISSIGYCQLIGKKVIKRLDKPILFPEYDYEKKGIEDPRIVLLDGVYYLVYTVFDGKNAQIAYATSKDLISFKKEGLLSPNIICDKVRNIFIKTNIGKKYDYFEKNYKKKYGKGIILWDKDAALFPKKIKGRYALLHRILPCIQISYFNDFSKLDYNYWKNFLENITESFVICPEPPYENGYVGAGSPPIETPIGWLLIYHFVELIKNKKIYHAGAAILDKNNPLKVIHRLKTPLFSPEEDWEKIGIVNDVVFPTGALIDKDRLYIHYGAADKLIALKSVNLKELLEELKNN
jgi:predicted GH43/DUF377 family glycosyl hydrolase